MSAASAGSSASATDRAAACLQRVGECLAGLEHRALAARDALPTIAVERALLRAVLVRLKERGGFEQATFVTAVDRFPAEPRFELVHQLLSYATNDRLRVKTALSGTDASAPSCTDLWPGAEYMERECFDMFGIRFEGHAGLKRLLMPEGYDHHPLRKDFPHHGIEPDRLYREWDARRRAGWDPES